MWLALGGWKKPFVFVFNQNCMFKPKLLKFILTRFDLIVVSNMFNNEIITLLNLWKLVKIQTVVSGPTRWVDAHIRVHT